MENRYTKSEQRAIIKQHKMADRREIITNIFKLLQKIGEGLYGKIHIIDSSEDQDNESYRIYHSDGYCIEFTREPEYCSDTDEWLQDHYCMYQRFEEFDKASEDFIFNELKEQIKLIN